MAHFLRRVRNKLRRLWYRWTGKPTGQLISISAANAGAIARNYPGVTAVTRSENGGLSPLVAGHLPEDLLDQLRPFNLTSETILLDIANPGFSFRNNLLYDPALCVLFGDDTGSDAEVLDNCRYVSRRCRKLDGTVAYLSNGWVDNYYHWMQLTMPLLRCYAELAPTARPDYFYVGDAALNGFQKETLARAGIAADRIVTRPCRADRLLAAIKIHRRQHGTRFRDRAGHDFVRALFATEPHSRPPRRYYIERGKVRHRPFAGEAALAEFLRGYGFEAVGMNGRSVAEQAALFAGASAIVAPHGAALTNLIFAEPRTKVIEIFPPGYQEPSYFTAATHGDLAYHYMIGNENGADTDKLARLLAKAGIDRDG